jgi:hypothetical protein
MPAAEVKVQARASIALLPSAASGGPADLLNGPRLPTLCGLR